MYCTSCGSKQKENDKFCSKCGHEIDSEVKTESDSLPITRKKNGMDIWLGLLGIGLIVSLLLNVVGGLEYLDFIGKDYDFPAFSNVLLFEFIAHIGLVIANCYLLYLYLMKKKEFPGTFLVYLAIFGIYGVLDYIAILSLQPPTVEFREILSSSSVETLSALLGSFIYIGVWSSYILLSKRVKKFFVE